MIILLFRSDSAIQNHTVVEIFITAIAISEIPAIKYVHICTYVEGEAV